MKIYGLKRDLLSHNSPVKPASQEQVKSSSPSIQVPLLQFAPIQSSKKTCMVIIIEIYVYNLRSFRLLKSIDFLIYHIRHCSIGYRITLAK